MNRLYLMRTNDINKKLDNLIWKERQKKTISIIAICILAGILILTLFLPPLGKSTQVTGEVIRLHGIQSKKGQSLYLIVKLGDNLKVMASISNTSQYRQGKKVNLLKIEPLIAGRDKYYFQDYVDENRSNKNN